MTPTYLIQIRRDAHTTTPVTVPEHEIPILMELFGEENVQNAEGKLIGKAGLGKPEGQFVLPEDEFSRLASKYGQNLIEAVFGKKAGQGLDNAIAAAKKRATKKE